jgi:hypothetical protein
MDRPGTIVKDRPCPCGKGYYRVSARYDEYGYHDEWTMHCAECSEQYTAFRYGQNLGFGRRKPAGVWVSGKQRNAYDRLNARLAKAVKKAAAHKGDREHYEAWMAAAPVVREKATVPRILAGEALCYPSLGDLPNYAETVEAETRWESAFYDPETLDALKVEDPTYRALVSRVARLRHQTAAALEALVADGYS